MAVLILRGTFLPDPGQKSQLCIQHNCIEISGNCPTNKNFLSVTLSQPYISIYLIRKPASGFLKICSVIYKKEFMCSCLNCKFNFYSNNTTPYMHITLDIL